MHSLTRALYLLRERYPSNQCGSLKLRWSSGCRRAMLHPESLLARRRAPPREQRVTIHGVPELILISLAICHRIVMSPRCRELLSIHICSTPAVPEPESTQRSPSIPEFGESGMLRSLSIPRQVGSAQRHCMVHPSPHHGPSDPRLGILKQNVRLFEDKVTQRTLRLLVAELTTNEGVLGALDERTHDGRRASPPGAARAISAARGVEQLTHRRHVPPIAQVCLHIAQEEAAASRPSGRSAAWGRSDSARTMSMLHTAAAPGGRSDCMRSECRRSDAIDDS